MYRPEALDFDGTSDYLTRGAGLTGAADGKVGLFSCWFRLDGSDGVISYFIRPDNARFYVAKLTSDKIRIFGKAGTVEIFKQDTTTAYTASGSWHSFIASFDLGNAKAYIYIDDVSVGGTPTTLTDSNVDYTATDWAVAATHTGANPHNGALAELYFALEYLDISVESNRRKFITAALKPEDLGSDGSTPTGTAPLIYMKFVSGAHGTNAGTGGNFTESGAPLNTAGPVTTRQARSKGALQKSRRIL